jgi:YspA, cpYpsA-related SLOG family
MGPDRVMAADPSTPQDRAAFRILVTGSRDWADEGLIAGALLLETSRRPASQAITVVHGGARGADEMAARIAVHYAWQAEPHPADWSAHGKGAGFRRNAEMVALGADICLAFIRDGSKGATHCADLAEKSGIPVRRFAA